MDVSELIICQNVRKISYVESLLMDLVLQQSILSLQIQDRILIIPSHLQKQRSAIMQTREYVYHNAPMRHKMTGAGELQCNSEILHK